jgi:hypothetical protein
VTLRDHPARYFVLNPIAVAGLAELGAREMARVFDRWSRSIVLTCGLAARLSRFTGLGFAAHPR